MRVFQRRRAANDPKRSLRKQDGGNTASFSRSGSGQFTSCKAAERRIKNIGNRKSRRLGNDLDSEAEQAGDHT